MILYISKEIDDNIGARLHQRAIRNIIGEKEVFTIYLSPAINQVKQTNYISYGKYKNKTERIRRWLQGNMMFISNGIIDELCNIIKDNDIKTVFIEDSVFGNFVKKVKSIFPDVKVISFYHDIKANLYKQWNKRVILLIKSKIISVSGRKILTRNFATSILCLIKEMQIYFILYMVNIPKV